MVFLTKTTVLTSILPSEVHDMVPQTQYELGKVPWTQSGTWENLVPQMCKSHQTTSVKELVIVNWSHVIANWSSKCIKEMVLKVLSCSSCSPNDKKRDKSKTFLCSKLENIHENLNFALLQLVMMSNTLKFCLFQGKNGYLPLGRFNHSSYFSFQKAWRCSALTTSQPPS